MGKRIGRVGRAGGRSKTPHTKRKPHAQHITHAKHNTTAHRTHNTLHKTQRTKYKYDTPHTQIITHTTHTTHTHNTHTPQRTNFRHIEHRHIHRKQAPKEYSSTCTHIDNYPSGTLTGNRHLDLKGKHKSKLKGS